MTSLKNKQKKGLAVLLGLFLLAKPLFAQIHIEKVEGHAFIMQEKKTRELSSKDVINNESEIITEENALVTFLDSMKGKHYLAGSSHLKLKSNEWILMNGNIWVNFGDSKNLHVVKTANAMVSSAAAEGIISFDASSDRTQIFSMRGIFNFSDLFEPKKNMVNVGAGLFTFFSSDLEENAPREATPLGYNSYNELMSFFKNVKNLGNSPAYSLDKEKNQGTEKKVTTALNDENKEKKKEQTPKHKSPGQILLLKEGKITKLGEENKKVEPVRSVASMKVKSHNHHKIIKNKNSFIKIFGHFSDVSMPVEKKEEIKPRPKEDATEKESEELKNKLEQYKETRPELPLSHPPAEKEVKDLMRELESYQQDTNSGESH